MTWQDRLRELKYISNSGVETLLAYEDANMSVEKRTSGHDFPRHDGTFVQDLGRDGRKFPFTVFFTGDDHDLEAKNFVDSLLEVGAGTLVHPIHGTFRVQPYGVISVGNRLTSEANQSTVEFSLWETLGASPRATSLSSGVVKQALVEALRRTTVSFAEGDAKATSDKKGINDREIKRAEISQALPLIEEKLGPLAQTHADIQERFKALLKGVTDTLDVIDDLADAAFQFTLLVSETTADISLVEDRIEAYSGMLDVILARSDEGEASFAVSYLLASAVVVSIGLSALQGTYLSRGDVVRAVDSVQQAQADYIAWYQAGYESIQNGVTGGDSDSAPFIVYNTFGSTIDLGGVLQGILESLGVLSDYLLDNTTGLKQELSIQLQSDTSLFVLAAKYYDSVDEGVSEIISTNGLIGTQILELTAGTQVTVYV